MASGESLIVGLALGLAFGLIEERIRRHREKRATGQPSQGLGSGAMSRTACLLVVLVGVQALCPVLFTDGLQWSASAGLLGGYGVVLYRSFLRLKRGLGA